MTVGELVERETAGGRTISEVGRGVMNYAGVQGVLVRLGIWDAEVHEGEFWYEAYEMPTFLDSEGAGMTFGLEDGDRVRIIVLPAKGE